MADLTNKVVATNFQKLLNVDSTGAVLTDGTGSNVSLNISGNITASGNISSSGTIYADNFQSTGGDIDGISFTDDLKISGNITASGDISASGWGRFDEGVFVSSLTSTGPFYAYGSIVGDNGTDISMIRHIATIGSSSFGDTLADTHKFVGHITQSGNISSSGTITAANFTTGDGLDISGNITASGNISASGNLTIGQWIYHGGETPGQTGINMTDKRIQFKAGGISYIDINDNEGPPRDFTLNDGSNNVDFKIKGSSNNPLFKTDASANRIGMHGVGTPSAGLHIGDNLLVIDEITTNSHITASGNISASGEVYGNILNAKTRVKAIGSSLEFAGDTLDFVDSNSTRYLFRGIDGGAFEAYHSGNKKLETTAGGIDVTGNITASGDIWVSGSGDILLDEDQRIYFEADKQTWMEANGANLVRIVTNNNQMLLLDHETGNRAVFGNGTKVFIGENNNALPSETLQVDGNISSSGAIHTLSHITASGNISSSGNIMVGKNKTFYTDSVTAIQSTIQFNNDVNVVGNITSSGEISASGTGNHYFGGPISASGNIITEGTILVKGDYLDLDEGTAIRWAAHNDPTDTTYYRSLNEKHLWGSGSNITKNYQMKLEMSGDSPFLQLGGSTSTLTANANSGKALTVYGDISASGDLYVAGNQIWFNDNYDDEKWISNVGSELRFGSGSNWGATVGLSVATSSLGGTRGNMAVGVNKNAPTKTLEVAGEISSSGDAYIGNSSSQGVILTSDNGTKYRLIVSDGGTLTTESV